MCSVRRVRRSRWCHMPCRRGRPPWMPSCSFLSTCTTSATTLLRPPTAPIQYSDTNTKADTRHTPYPFHDTMAPTPHPQSQEPINVKLLLIGNVWVGKTRLHDRFFDNQWSSNDVTATTGSIFPVRSQFSRLSLFLIILTMITTLWVALGLRWLYTSLGAVG